MVRNKVYIARDYHIQPSEIDRMIFFEYEYLLEDINEIQKQQEEENKKYDDMMNNTKLPNYNSLAKSYASPKMPPMPKVSVPKF